jgi:CRISPR/Cas system endoribonuclease Cas6 (RAMP superfamily)
MEDREKLILQKIAEKESIELMQLRGVKSIVYEILINEKAFYPEEIQIDPQFMLTLSTCDAKVSIDFMITLEEISFMVIRCVSSGIEPWERYAVAFARAIKNYQIPYAVITDGEYAKVIDVINDSFVYGSVQELFTRHAAMNLMRNFQKIPCPEKKREKEKRIIYAFEGIKYQPDK